MDSYMAIIDRYARSLVSYEINSVSRVTEGLCRSC